MLMTCCVEALAGSRGRESEGELSPRSVRLQGIVVSTQEKPTGSPDAGTFPAVAGSGTGQGAVLG